MAYLNLKPYVQNIRDCQTQPLISLGRNQTTSKLLCQAQGQGTGEQSYYKRALYGPKGAEPPAFPTCTPLSLRPKTVEETESTLRTPKNVNKHFFKEEEEVKFLGSCVGVVFIFNTPIISADLSDSFPAQPHGHSGQAGDGRRSGIWAQKQKYAAETGADFWPHLLRRCWENAAPFGPVPSSLDGLSNAPRR